MTQQGTIETACEIARVFVCGEHWRNSAAWCDGCESEVPMITELTAAILEKTDSVTIFRRVEAGELHHKVTADGALLFCFSSLLNRWKSDLLNWAETRISKKGDKNLLLSGLRIANSNSTL